MFASPLTSTPLDHSNELPNIVHEQILDQTSNSMVNSDSIKHSTNDFVEQVTGQSSCSFPKDDASYGKDQTKETDSTKQSQAPTMTLSQLQKHSNATSVSTSGEDSERLFPNKCEAISNESKELFPPRRFYNDPTIPYTLSLYTQLALNVIIGGIFVYFIYHFFHTISLDIDGKVGEYSSEILAEIAECSNQYLRNNCMPGRRVPALESVCQTWERCMNRDPEVVGRTRVSAETLSQVIDSFLRPLSIRTWLMLIGSFTFAVIFPNALFSFFRLSKTNN